MKARVSLETAEKVAMELTRILTPCCNRIVVAGSIRRRCPEPSDIELLVIPRANYLDKLLHDLMMQNVLAMRLNKRGQRAYGPKNKLMVHLPSGIGLDVFSTTAENWGMALFVRTGPREWNIKAMSRFRELCMQGHAYGGVTDANGRALNCPDEETVFQRLQWAYVSPERRV